LRAQSTPWESLAGTDGDRFHDQSEKGNPLTRFMAMKVLICSPGLGFQVDAAYSTRMRAHAMIEAGLDVVVMGYPSAYPAGAKPCRFRYESILGGVSVATQRLWSRLSRRLGAYWTFGVEPFLVMRACLDRGFRQGFDVVYITHLEPWIVVPLLLEARLRRRRVPLVGMIPTVFYAKTAMQGRPLLSRLRAGINQALSRWLARHMHVLCNSRYVAEVMQLPRNQFVHIVPEGYEKRGAGSTQADARRRLGLPQDKRMVLLFGVASRAKGSDLLLTALETLPPEFRVCIVGQTGGVYEQSWGDTKRLEERGWTAYLHIVPRYVTDAEMEDYYAACDVVVVPYRRGFATSSTHLRMATEWGKPIIASDQYLLGELVRKYRLGLLFEPDDAADLRRCLEEFAGKPEAWFAEIRDNSRALVVDESWGKVGEKYRDLFAGITGRVSESSVTERGGVR
jgi:glycosyltransferase involved in cell wall biosynthesis